MNEETNQGLSLLRKGQKGLIHLIFCRLGLICLLLAFHLFLLFSVFRWFAGFLPHIFGGSLLFTAVMGLYLLNSKMDASVKLTWLVLVMLLPVFGALLFWFTQSDIGHRTLKKRMNQLIDDTWDCIPQAQEALDRLKREAPGAAALAHYLGRTGCYPAYDHTDVSYFPLGEEMWEQMLRELEGAKQFIFLEYFIVDEGVM